MRKPIYLATGLLIALPVMALAQTVPGAIAPPGQPSIPSAPGAPGPAVPGPVPPEQIRPPGSPQGPLSPGAAIVPPNVDPGMDKTPPAGGAMPVIPPPGSPGSSSNVRPK